MILVINTATEKVSIALLGDKIAKEVSWKSYRTQSKELLPKIDRLLKKNRVKLKNLDAIAVFQGPGSYTGLRVGISIANAMGWALGIPVIGIRGRPSTVDRRQMNALEIAKRSHRILSKKKSTKFQRIVIPYYGSQLK